MSAAKKKNPEAEGYYPGGDYKYAEKDAGGMSNAKVGTDKADLSDPKLAAARDAVKGLNSETNWLVLGYEGLTSNKLKVVGTGDGGFAEMVDELHPASPMFALLKVKVDGMNKFAYVTWNPNGVPPLQKGLMGPRARDVGRFFEPIHLQHDASSDSDMDEEKIMEKLKRATNK